MVVMASERACAARQKKKSSAKWRRNRAKDVPDRRREAHYRRPRTPRTRSPARQAFRAWIDRIRLNVDALPRVTRTGTPPRLALLDRPQAFGYYPGGTSVR